MSAEANIAADNVPVLTINREATIDLDSSSAFEGKQTFSLKVMTMTFYTDKHQAQRSFLRFGLLPLRQQFQNLLAMPRPASLD